MNRPACLLLSIAAVLAGSVGAEAFGAEVIDAATLRGKVVCGYQGWFRCPGDAANLGWVHWSRTRRQITPESLTFEMWPDMREYGAGERFAAPGFAYPDGRQAELFSSDSAVTVLRHFQWMREYGIDGAFLQRFLVGLPGGPGAVLYPSNQRVLHYVDSAAEQTGRVWGISYDIARMPPARTFEVLTSDWKKLVDDKTVAAPRYLHEGGRPVVQIWGFYRGSAGNQMSAELANQLIDFFKTPGPYSAYLAGGGSWNWRQDADPQWQKYYRRLDAYSPWNPGNYLKDKAGQPHANTRYWADDQRECKRVGMLWMPVIYPGFGWDNLTRKPPGSTQIARRGGRFLWEQFHELSKLGVDTVYVAMFDEVDEGTAIFKVTSSPPTQAHFVGYEGLPSDWYLRLTGEAARMLRGKRPIPAEIPIKPSQP